MDPNESRAPVGARAQGSGQAVCARERGGTGADAQVLGLLTQDAELFLDQQRGLKLPSTGMSVAEVERLIALRHEARLAKNFAESDRIRDELVRRRIFLEDGPEGTRWRVGDDREGSEG